MLVDCVRKLLVIITKEEENKLIGKSTQAALYCVRSNDFLEISTSNETYHNLSSWIFFYEKRLIRHKWKTVFTTLYQLEGKIIVVWCLGNTINNLQIALKVPLDWRFFYMSKLYEYSFIIGTWRVFRSILIVFNMCIT